MVTHPGTNRAQQSATSLIETNALPLNQTANHYTYNNNNTMDHVYGAIMTV